MPPKFGTSGLRGLVTELTAPLVADYVGAFLTACDIGAGVFVGQDLRQSSPDLAACVVDTLIARGIDVVDCGPIPTPALALSAMAAGYAAIMVTDSHIPTDRNGLKFYTPGGEITKADEAAILAALGQTTPTGTGQSQSNPDAVASYVARYRTSFAGALSGLRLGLYQHSAVGRDLMVALLTALGADVVPLGRSDSFIPIDTEAVATGLRADLKYWAETHRLDAIVSTDADSDRPLTTDEAGCVILGDLLGQMTAQYLRAAADPFRVDRCWNTAFERSGRPRGATVYGV